MKKLCFAALAGLSLTASLCTATPDTNDEVKFIVFADSQFNNMSVYERMVHEADALCPAFIIQCGDLIQGYTYDKENLREEWKRFQKQIDPLTVPFYPVPGNHDTVTQESQEVYTETWGEDRLVYSFDTGPVHNIVLDTYFNDEDEQIADWQQEWLANDLKEYAAANGGEGSEELAKRSIFVYMHSPLWRYNKDHPGYKDWTQIHNLFKKYPVKLVSGGHTHEYVWQNFDGIDYLVLNSSGSMGGVDQERGGRFHSFLHVTAKPDGHVRYAVVKAGSILPIDTVDNNERSTNPALYLGGGTLRVPAWNEGEALDLEVTLPVTNNLDEPRTYRLDWKQPHGADVTITPTGMWLTVDPGATETIAFNLKAESTPATALMPWLEMSSEHLLRTGTVSRDWEARYLQEIEDAKSDPSILTTNIKLKDTVVYTGHYKLFVPPIIKVSEKESEIIIDGKLDDKAWASATIVDDLRPTDGTDPLVQTKIRFLYDDDSLYLGAWFEEPSPENLKASAEGDIPLTWNDDDLELFFDPQRTENLYWRLFQNSVGTRFNSKPRNVDNKYYKSTYESKISINDDHWVLEMKIPYEEAGAEKGPESGTKWGFNMSRHRQQSEPTRVEWTPGTYNASTYGYLEFE